MFEGGGGSRNRSVFRKGSGALEFHSSQAEGQAVMVCCRDCAAGKGEDHNEKDSDAARGVFLSWGEQGDERAEN